MSRVLRVKGKTIGAGTPMICVSVMDKDKEGILAEISRLIRHGAEMIEWRVDAFSGLESPNAVREVLKEAAPMLKDTIFIFTFRSKEQGGECSLSSQKVYDLHQIAAESHVVDFIDVEYFYTEDADKSSGIAGYDIQPAKVDEIVDAIQLYAVTSGFAMETIDIHSLTEKNSEWFETDGIHPNNDGAKAVAEAVAEAIQK